MAEFEQTLQFDSRDGEYESGYYWTPDELTIGGTIVKTPLIIDSYIMDKDNRSGISDEHLEKRLELYFKMPFSDIKKWWQTTKTHDIKGNWSGSAYKEKLPDRETRYASSTELMNNEISSPELEMLYEKIYDAEDYSREKAMIEEAIGIGWDIDDALTYGGSYATRDGQNIADIINTYELTSNPEYWDSPHAETAVKEGINQSQQFAEEQEIWWKQKEEEAARRHKQMLEDTFTYDISDREEAETGGIMNWLKGLVK